MRVRVWGAKMWHGEECGGERGHHRGDARGSHREARVHQLLSDGREVLQGHPDLDALVDPAERALFRRWRVRKECELGVEDIAQRVDLGVAGILDFELGLYLVGNARSALTDGALLTTARSTTARA